SPIIVLSSQCLERLNQNFTPTATPTFSTVSADCGRQSHSLRPENARKALDLDTPIREAPLQQEGGIDCARRNRSACNVGPYDRPK
ncbi:hypothetical protein, partial [Rhizobium fabae]|uniref:hypothetical protein n=1 Tax=Rhizobium fabae TaxID=573179 RepID=UPI001AEDBBAC